MSKKKKIALESVLQSDENIYWEGHPEKLPYILYELKDYWSELILRLVFDLVLLPILFINTTYNFNVLSKIILLFLWLWHLTPIIKIMSKPLEKLLEWKNTFYIITDKNIYMQFGKEQVYYRVYPSNRIGTKVFYRKNKIDSTLFTGTIGFSVDDYYEERFMSIKDYDDVYKVLRSFTNLRKEELKKEFETEQLRKTEILNNPLSVNEYENVNKNYEMYKNTENETENLYENDDETYEDEDEDDDYNQYDDEEEDKRIEEIRSREREELMNKYNEYKKRNNNDNYINNNSNNSNDNQKDDSVSEEYSEKKEYNQKPYKKSKPYRNNYRNDNYKYDLSKRKPETENNSKYSKFDDNEIKKQEDTGEDLDMSMLWNNINDNTNNN
jgi:hypothetical protein